MAIEGINDRIRNTREKKQIRIAILWSIMTLTLFIGIAYLASCQSFSQSKSPVEIAKIAYVDASLSYQTTMNILVTLRAAHQINDAQWSRIDTAQTEIRKIQPILRSALTIWEATNTKPSTYDDINASMINAIAELLRVQKEVNQ